MKRDRYSDGYYGDDEVTDEELKELIGTDGFHIEEPEPFPEFDNFDDLFDHLVKEKKEEEAEWNTD